MSVLYLLWGYGEVGLDPLVATLNRDRVVALAATLNGNRWFERGGHPALLDELRVLLDRVGDSPGDHWLFGYNHGLHLTIVELEEVFRSDDVA